MSSKHAFVVCLLALLLAACVSPSTAAVTPAASALPPAPTRTPAPTASPTPQPITVSEIGLTTPALQTAFAGAEKTVTREKDSYTVESFYYGGEDGTKKVDAKYTIDTKSWNANPDIKDDLTRPLEVEAVRLDENDQEVKVKLLWMGEKIGWFEELDMAKSDMTALAKTKTLTPEDFANNVYVDLKEPGAHLALLMSARAYYAKNGAPFSQDALKRLEKNGMNSLLFEHFPDKDKNTENDPVVGVLKNRGEGDFKTRTYDNSPLKYLMSFKTTNRNGKIVHYFIGGNLAPQDLKDPASVNDFLMMIMTNFEGTVVEKDGKKIYGNGIVLTDKSNCGYYARAFDQNPSLFPRPIFYANGPYRKLYPEVDRVLNQPDNDPGQLPFPAHLDVNSQPQWVFADFYEQGINGALGNKDNLGERPVGEPDSNNNPIYAPLPREVQNIVFTVFNITQ